MASRLISGVLCLCLVACDRDSTPPTEPSGHATSFLVTFDAFPGNTFSVDLSGTTFDARGSFEVSMAGGTHEVSGTFLGTGLVIGFGRQTGGGVLRGSLETLEGPGAQTQGCTVAWNNPFPGRLQTIRASFTVTTGGALCQQ